MCRFLAYHGKPITMDELIYQPKNSLIRQSANAHEAEEPLNGDGFGVGWYTPELDSEPGLYVSIRPAWNDRNLKYLSKHVKTRTLFAHVRAASEGEVSESNCHPFHFGDYLFMHNGGLGDFAKIKRYVRRLFCDEIYNWIRGQTDSEHLFAMVLENLKKLDKKPTPQDLALTIEATIKQIQEIKKEHGITEDCYINCVLTDGKVMVAVRYVSNPNEKASTLYYSAGDHYECRDGVCVMKTGASQKSVLVVSEKLTDIQEEWVEIPENSICIIDEHLNVKIRELNDGQGKVKDDGAPKGTGFIPTRKLG